MNSLNTFNLMKRFTFTFSDVIWHTIYEPLLRRSRIFRTFVVWYSYLKRRNRVKPVPKEILSNKEWKTHYHIDHDWFTREKKMGISGVARLKNSADFLEGVVRAFLPYLDEIILVAEQATDGTNEICERLAQEYPDKVRYFFYPFAIRFRDYDWDDQPTSDSVYSFAYFTNWAFSKTTYKYVMRLDDDIFPIPETWEKMRKYILEKQPNEYLLYYGVNVLARWNRYGVMTKIPRCWTWGDNGIYPVSEYTYFTQIVWSTEAFHLNLLYKPFWFGYLHLKNLKKWAWTADYAHSEWGKYFQKLSHDSVVGEFHEYLDFPSSRIYEILLDNSIIWTR